MGAKFSGGSGATLFYDDGIKTAASGTTGTQRNEFEAAIKSVTSSTDVGAVYLYDTSQDSDPSWRKRCKGLSWFDEGSSTTRSARSEFPAMALIVADNASSATLTVYDLDDPAMPVWMVFNASTSSKMAVFAQTTAPASSCYALNGRVYVAAQTGSGGTGGLSILDFAGDEGYFLRTGTAVYSTGSIAGRDSVSFITTTKFGGIVDASCNDVSATILEGAEIGALGLPVPTVAVACNANGANVIHSNGDVYNFKTGAYGTNAVAWSGDSLVMQSLTSTQRRVDVLPLGTLYADIAALSNIDVNYNLTNTAWSPSSGMALGQSQDVLISAGDRTLAQGGSSGLQIVKRDNGFSTDSGAHNLAAYITSTYNTGYMVGDIRGAWLANDAPDGGTSGETFADRSVKGNNLTETGRINAGEVATSAEMKGFSNFSASNYLSQAYDADFDFADGLFSVMCWVKVVAGSSYQAIANRYDAGDTGKGWTMYVDPSEQVYMYVYGASNVSSGYTGVLSDGWHFICGVSDGAEIKIYADGVLANSGTLAAGDLSNSAAELHIGIEYDEANYPQTGSLSLLRISATVPTPQQIKEIYEAEKVLFRSGAKCLLAANQVNDLAYDKTSGLLHVASESTASSKSFRGLEAVESLTSDGSLGLTAATEVDGITAAGGVIAAYDNAKAGVNLPSIDVRAELLEGESKIPDDGKFHFSGVTTSNGGDVIAHIPIAEEENVTVNAHVTAKGYGADLGTHYANYILTEQFYRAAGGDVTSAVAETSIVSQESAAGLDATLGVDTSADTAKITVTGDASDRVVWTATVEVIRDAEKSYER